MKTATEVLSQVRAIELFLECWKYLLVDFEMAFSLAISRRTVLREHNLCEFSTQARTWPLVMRPCRDVTK